MWNTLKMILVIALVGFSLTGCTGCKERVMPGQVAKVLTTAGFQPDVYEPGYVTCWGRDKLVTLDVTTHRVKEDVVARMRDDLQLPFDVYVRTRIDRDNIEGMFNDITPDWEAGGDRGNITFSRVYDTYGKMLVRNIARQVLMQYETAQVKEHYDQISTEIYEALGEAFASIPLQLEDVTISGFEYPKVITEAYEIAAQREIEIREIEARRAKDMASKEAELALASKDREIELMRAETMRDYNKIIGAGISEAWMVHRHYEVLEAMAHNGNAVFMPYEAYRPDNAGLHTAMFRNQEEVASEADGEDEATQ